MKYYSPSNELANVLFKNGFIETTDKFYKHYQTGIYDPNTDCRCFSLLKGKRNIIFKYTEFRFWNAESNIKTIENNITEQQLISVIAFYKLSHQLRKSFQRNHVDITHLQQFIIDYRSLPKYKEKILSVERALKEVII